jgi:hypothetical protein
MYCEWCWAKIQFSWLLRLKIIIWRGSQESSFPWHAKAVCSNICPINDWITLQYQRSSQLSMSISPVRIELEFWALPLNLLAFRLGAVVVLRQKFPEDVTTRAPRAPSRNVSKSYQTLKLSTENLCIIFPNGALMNFAQHICIYLDWLNSNIVHVYTILLCREGQKVTDSLSNRTLASQGRNERCPFNIAAFSCLSNSDKEWFPDQSHTLH